MRLAFLDTEFTGEHAFTTLVSLAVVGVGGEVLHVAFDDFDRDQVTPWLEENVLRHIDPSTMVDRRTGFEIVRRWFDDYAGGDTVTLVTAGKMSDLILLFELWHLERPEWRWFHHLHGLPPYLNHATHLDLPTVFLLAGVDPSTDRDAFCGIDVPGPRHDALHDALVVRECFRRCVTDDAFPLAFAALQDAIPATWR